VFHQMIEKAVHKSQHCQRNWDLTQEVPEKDLKVMETAITQCPSKQNYAYYKPYIITDRKKIEAIYDQTDGFDYNAEGDTVKNVQVLANVLVAFAEDDQYKTATREDYRELNAIEAVEAGEELPEQVRQRNISIGIAAGYLNLSASMMGYSTGCCTCFDGNKVAEILGTDKPVNLLMGVGIADESRPRREKHDDPEFVYPTYKKYLDAVRVA
jgi:nitroreductase